MQLVADHESIVYLLPADVRCFLMALHGQSISLRAFVEGDADFVEQLLNGWEGLALFRPDAVIWTPADIVRRFDDTRTFVVERNGDRNPLGLARVGEHDVLHQTAELGVYLAEGHRGGGLGADTGVLLLHYCFYHLNIEKVLFRVFETNSHSKHVVEGLGFAKEGVLRSQVFRGGCRQDVYLYGLIRSEYEASTKLGDVRARVLLHDELARIAEPAQRRQ